MKRRAAWASLIAAIVGISPRSVGRSGGRFVSRSRALPRLPITGSYARSSDPRATASGVVLRHQTSTGSPHRALAHVCPSVVTSVMARPTLSTPC
jgi:hypothetical protein